MRSKIISKAITRKYVSAFILISVSVGLSLILSELTLRFVPYLLPSEVQQVVRATPDDFGVSHPYIGNLHTADNTFILSGRDFKAAHHTDGHGFRNSWPWPEKADVVALGDSLTFGQGVENEHAWPAILGRSLPENRVINLGLIGAGPQQYLRVYETFGVKLRPKVLLIGLFARNDFWDEGLFDRWWKSAVGGNYMVWRDFGRPKGVGPGVQQPIARLIKSLQWQSYVLLRRSHLFNLLLYVRGTIRSWIPSEVKVFQTADGTRLRLLPADAKSKTVGAQPDRSEFRLVLQSLQRIHSTARAHGTHVVVIFQPGKEEVYLPLLGEDVPDASGPLYEELKRLDVVCLDLLPAFRERAAKGEKLFFEVDGHPNARGYALIAELVLSHLKENATKYGLKDRKRESSQAKL